MHVWDERHYELRRELLAFLDTNVFNPVMAATPEQYSSERDRRILLEVQRAMSAQRADMHSAAHSARDVRDGYIRWVYYETVTALGNHLEDLELPRFRQIAREFFTLCERLRI